MAHTLQLLRASVLLDALFRVFNAPLWGAPARARARRHQLSSLAEDTLRDIGSTRQFQEYAGAVAASSDRDLHRLADAARWAAPR